MDLQKVIELRQSIRRYKEGDIPEEDLRQIVSAAGKAPSGKNIQNWHFVSIKNKEIKGGIGEAIIKKNEEIAAQLEISDKPKADAFRKFTKNFTLFALKAPVLTLVYACVYKPSGYHEMRLADMPLAELEKLINIKNPGIQNIGAAVQNFSLKAVDMGYGTCWLTSANYAADEIEAYIKSKTGFEKKGYSMVAMISLGIPEDNQRSPSKKSVDEIFTYFA